MKLNEIASAILNDLWGGNLVPESNRSLISLEQIEDECIAERELLIMEYILKGLCSAKDFATDLNCINVDCKSEKICKCKEDFGAKSVHFEIPATVSGIENDGILFIGSSDRALSYNIYNSKSEANIMSYRRRKSDKPYVVINKVENENGNYDGWIYNAPFIKEISVTGVFKNPKNLCDFGCGEHSDFDFGMISNDVIAKILSRKTNLYRTPAYYVSQTV